jgi:thiol-disulfide isomerase/thioredoxin
MRNRLTGAGLVVLMAAGCNAPTAPAPTHAVPPVVETLPPEVPVAAEVVPEKSATFEALAPANRQANDDEPIAKPSVTLQAVDWAAAEAIIAGHAGKIVVVDVWSTSCEPCLREFPHLIALQKQYPDDVVCIGLNCDYVGIKKKPPEFYHAKVSKVLEEQHAEIVNLLCTLPSDDLFAALKIDSIPAVFIYDRSGKKVHTFDNRTPAGEGEGISYEKQVEPAVAVLVKPE